MTRWLPVVLLLAASASSAQDTLRVPLAAVPGTGPFSMPAGPGQSIEGIGLGPTGLDDALGAQVYEEAVWVPGAEGFALVTWAVAETPDGALTLWIDADGDRDLAEEEPYVYPPLAVPEGGDARRAAAEANAAVRPDPVTVRHGGREARVTLEPFLYAVDEDGAPLRDADGSRQVFVRVGQHHRGWVEIGGEAFDVYLDSDAPRSIAYAEGDTRVWVVPEGTEPTGEPYGWGEAFRVGDHTVRLVGVEADASALALVVGSEAPDAVGTRVGQTAPLFEARTLAGDTLRLADLRGRYVLLEFWGTWCAPCVAYAPDLAAAYARYPRDRFEIVGVASDEASAVRQFVEDEGLGWPQIVEPSGERAVTSLYGVSGYPTTLLLDPEGTVIYRGLGYGPRSAARLAAALGE
jgi:peroxiredoxin